MDERERQSQMNFLNKLSEDAKKSYIGFQIRTAKKEGDLSRQNLWADIANSQGFIASEVEQIESNNWMDELAIIDGNSYAQTEAILTGLSLDTQKDQLIHYIEDSKARGNEARTLTLLELGKNKGLFTSSEAEELAYVGRRVAPGAPVQPDSNYQPTHLAPEEPNVVAPQVSEGSRVAPGEPVNDDLNYQPRHLAQEEPTMATTTTFTSIPTQVAADRAAGIREAGDDFKSAYDSGHAIEELLNEQEQNRNYVEQNNGQFMMGEFADPTPQVEPTVPLAGGGVVNPVGTTPQQAEEHVVETIDEPTPVVEQPTEIQGTAEYKKYNAEDIQVHNLGGILNPVYMSGGVTKNPKPEAPTENIQSINEEIEQTEKDLKNLSSEERAEMLAQKRQDIAGKMTDEELLVKLGREAYALRKDGKVLTPQQQEALRRYEDRMEILKGKAVSARLAGKELTTEEKEALAMIPNLQGLEVEEYQKRRDAINSQQLTVDAVEKAAGIQPDHEMRVAEEAAQTFIEEEKRNLMNPENIKSALIGATLGSFEFIPDEAFPDKFEEQIAALDKWMVDHNFQTTDLPESYQTYIEEIKIKARQKEREKEQEEKLGAAPVVQGNGIDKEEEKKERLTPVVLFKRAGEKTLNALKKHKKGILVMGLATLVVFSVRSCNSQANTNDLSNAETLEPQNTIEHVVNRPTPSPSNEYVASIGDDGKVQLEEVRDQEEEKDQEVELQAPTQTPEQEQTPSGPKVEPDPEPELEPTPTPTPQPQPEPENTPEIPTPTPNPGDGGVEDLEQISTLESEPGYVLEVETNEMGEAERFQGQTAEQANDVNVTLGTSLSDSGELNPQIDGESYRVKQPNGKELIIDSSGDVLLKDGNVSLTEVGTTNAWGPTDANTNIVDVVSVEQMPEAPTVTEHVGTIVDGGEIFQAPSVDNVVEDAPTYAPEVEQPTLPSQEVIEHVGSSVLSQLNGGSGASSFEGNVELTNTNTVEHQSAQMADALVEGMATGQISIVDGNIVENAPVVETNTNGLGM